MRKKKEFRDANRSGTSTNALEKVENRFMEWISSFIQPRDGRTNIKKVSDNKNNTSEPEKDELEKNEDDEEGMSLDEEDTLDNWEQPNQSFSQRKEDEEVCVEDKVLSLMVPLNQKMGRHQLRVPQKIHYLKKWNFPCYPKLILE